MSEARRFRVGLLGHGTVGSAFATLLAERAAEVRAATGLRPEISGVLTRSRGDFGDILERSDLVVEVMGGLEPAREYVLRAMPAGRHDASLRWLTVETAAGPAPGDWLSLRPRQTFAAIRSPSSRASRRRASSSQMPSSQTPRSPTPPARRRSRWPNQPATAWRRSAR